MIRKLVGALLLVLFVSVGTVHAADYVVQPGDTLSEIALEIKVPMGRLARLNRLKDLDYIQAGQTLEYLSEEDVQNAIAFCEAVSTGFFMGAGGVLTTEWLNQLRTDAMDLRAGRIRYVDGEPGLPAENVLEMAKSLRLLFPNDHFVPSLPHTFPEIVKKVFVVGDHFSSLHQP